MRVKVSMVKVSIATICVFLLHAYESNGWQTSQPPRCQSPIYCTGELLNTIQMAKIFNDSKTFVDMKLKQSPNRTIQLFKEFMADHSDIPSREDVRKFVNDNFEPRGSEFHPWTPNDWKENPKYINNIKDPAFKRFAFELNDLWKVLGRKMRDEITEHNDLYSIIYVKNGVIVPGGRFLEFYYWDSYWIIRGLLHSDMFETAKGMLRNFLSLINRFGFIPNGGRIYYLTRSHPPLLSLMVDSYVQMTDDVEFIKEALPLLEREFSFFEDNHMIKVKDHYLATYGYEGIGEPRPESYYEDVKMARDNFKTDLERGNFYSEIIAAAESGMDFSSRWFIRNGSNMGVLANAKTRSIIPVELNAMLYKNAKIIAKFHDKLGNTNIADRYEYKAKLLYDAVQAVLWDSTNGVWFDYDLVNHKLRPYFTPTNLSPLWFDCFDESNKSNIARKILTYIESTSIDSFPGGVPNTFSQTGEQWDYPNVWAPMQYIITEGLRKLDDKDGSELAEKWTTRWTRSNYIAYNDTHYMFEKYSAEELGGHGSGGEYDVQIGFGWSNGVIIEYLARYGKKFDINRLITVYKCPI